MEYTFHYNDIKHLELLPPEHGEVDDNFKDCRAILEVDLFITKKSRHRVHARCRKCWVYTDFWVIFDNKK